MCYYSPYHFTPDATRSESNTGDRLKKLIIATKEFNHYNCDKHNSDIKAGAVTIVCSLIKSCAPFSKSSSPFNEEEIRTCLRMLVRLYRSSDQKRLQASFCTDASTLISLLLELIEINFRLGSRGDAKSLVLAQDIMAKLISVARVKLTWVKDYTTMVSSLIDTINGATGKFVMHQSMQLIATLSEHDDNKRLLLTFDRFLESIAIRTTHMYESVREESSRIIMNLASNTKNQLFLIQQEKQYWIETVLKLAGGPRTSNAYAYSIQTLGYLASVPENKIIMVHHRNGVVVDTLLRVAVSSYESNTQSINAIRVLSRLTCRATASTIGNFPELLSWLSSLACRHDKLAVASAMVVKKIGTYVRSGDECHTNLLQALVTMSFSRSTEVLKWVVKAYREQTSYETNRLRMIGHKGLLASLSLLTKDNNEFVKMHAEEVLGLLASK